MLTSDGGAMDYTIEAAHSLTSTITSDCIPHLCEIIENTLAELALRTVLQPQAFNKKLMPEAPIRRAGKGRERSASNAGLLTSNMSWGQSTLLTSLKPSKHAQSQQHGTGQESHVIRTDSLPRYEKKRGSDPLWSDWDLEGSRNAARRANTSSTSESHEGRSSAAVTIIAPAFGSPVQAPKTKHSKSNSTSSLAASSTDHTPRSSIALASTLGGEFAGLTSTSGRMALAPQQLSEVHCRAVAKGVRGMCAVIDDMLEAALSFGTEDAFGHADDGQRAHSAMVSRYACYMKAADAISAALMHLQMGFNEAIDRTTGASAAGQPDIIASHHHSNAKSNASMIKLLQHIQAVADEEATGGLASVSNEDYSFGTVPTYSSLGAPIDNGLSGRAGLRWARSILNLDEPIESNAAVPFSLSIAYEGAKVRGPPKAAKRPSDIPLQPKALPSAFASLEAQPQPPGIGGDYFTSLVSPFSKGTRLRSCLVEVLSASMDVLFKGLFERIVDREWQLEAFTLQHKVPNFFRWGLLASADKLYDVHTCMGSSEVVWAMLGLAGSTSHAPPVQAMDGLQIERALIGTILPATPTTRAVAVLLNMSSSTIRWHSRKSFKVFDECEVPSLLGGPQDEPPLNGKSPAKQLATSNAAVEMEKRMGSLLWQPLQAQLLAQSTLIVAVLALADSSALRSSFLGTLVQHPEQLLSAGNSPQLYDNTALIAKALPGFGGGHFTAVVDALEVLRKRVSAVVKANAPVRASMLGASSAALLAQRTAHASLNFAIAHLINATSEGVPSLPLSNSATSVVSLALRELVDACKGSRETKVLLCRLVSKVFGPLSATNGFAALADNPRRILEEILHKHIHEWSTKQRYAIFSLPCAAVLLCVCGRSRFVKDSPKVFTSLIRAASDGASYPKRYARASFITAAGMLLSFFLAFVLHPTGGSAALTQEGLQQQPVDSERQQMEFSFRTMVQQLREFGQTVLRRSGSVFGGSSEGTSGGIGGPEGNNANAMLVAFANVVLALCALRPVTVGWPLLLECFPTEKERERDGTSVIATDLTAAGMLALHTLTELGKNHSQKMVKQGYKAPTKEIVSEMVTNWLWMPLPHSALFVDDHFSSNPYQASPLADLEDGGLIIDSGFTVLGKDKKASLLLYSGLQQFGRLFDMLLAEKGTSTPDFSSLASVAASEMAKAPIVFSIDSQSTLRDLMVHARLWHMAELATPRRKWKGPTPSLCDKPVPFTEIVISVLSGISMYSYGAEASQLDTLGKAMAQLRVPLNNPKAHARQGSTASIAMSVANESFGGYSGLGSATATGSTTYTTTTLALTPQQQSYLKVTKTLVGVAGWMECEVLTDQPENYILTPPVQRGQPGFGSLFPENLKRELQTTTSDFPPLSDRSSLCLQLLLTTLACATLWDPPLLLQTFIRTTQVSLAGVQPGGVGGPLTDGKDGASEGTAASPPASLIIVKCCLHRSALVRGIALQSFLPSLLLHDDILEVTQGDQHSAELCTLLAGEISVAEATLSALRRPVTSARPTTGRKQFRQPTGSSLASPREDPDDPSAGLKSLGHMAQSILSLRHTPFIHNLRQDLLGMYGGPLESSGMGQQPSTSSFPVAFFQQGPPSAWMWSHFTSSLTHLTIAKLCDVCLSLQTQQYGPQAGRDGPSAVFEALQTKWSRGTIGFLGFVLDFLQAEMSKASSADHVSRFIPPSTIAMLANTSLGPTNPFYAGNVSMMGGTSLGSQDSTQHGVGPGGVRATDLCLSPFSSLKFHNEHLGRMPLLEMLNGVMASLLCHGDQAVRSSALTLAGPSHNLSKSLGSALRYFDEQIERVQVERQLLVKLSEVAQSAAIEIAKDGSGPTPRNVLTARYNATTARPGQTPYSAADATPPPNTPTPSMKRGTDSMSEGSASLFDMPATATVFDSSLSALTSGVSIPKLNLKGPVHPSTGVVPKESLPTIVQAPFTSIAGPMPAGISDDSSVVGILARCRSLLAQLFLLPAHKNTTRIGVMGGDGPAYLASPDGFEPTLVEVAALLCPQILDDTRESLLRTSANGCQWGADSDQSAVSATGSSEAAIPSSGSPAPTSSADRFRLVGSSTSYCSLAQTSADRQGLFQVCIQSSLGIWDELTIDTRNILIFAEACQLTHRPQALIAQLLLHWLPIASPLFATSLLQISSVARHISYAGQRAVTRSAVRISKGLQLGMSAKESKASKSTQAQPPNIAQLSADSVSLDDRGASDVWRAHFMFAVIAAGLCYHHEAQLETRCTIIEQQMSLGEGYILLALQQAATSLPFSLDSLPAVPWERPHAQVMAKQAPHERMHFGHSPLIACDATQKNTRLADLLATIAPTVLSRSHMSQDSHDGIAFALEEILLRVVLSSMGEGPTGLPGPFVHPNASSALLEMAQRLSASVPQVLKKEPRRALILTSVGLPALRAALVLVTRPSMPMPPAFGHLHTSTQLAERTRQQRIDAWMASGPPTMPAPGQPLLTLFSPDAIETSRVNMTTARSQHHQFHHTADSSASATTPRLSHQQVLAGGSTAAAGANIQLVNFFDIFDLYFSLLSGHKPHDSLAAGADAAQEEPSAKGAKGKTASSATSSIGNRNSGLYQGALLPALPPWESYPYLAYPITAAGGGGAPITAEFEDWKRNHNTNGFDWDCAMGLRLRESLFSLLFLLATESLGGYPRMVLPAFPDSPLPALGDSWGQAHFTFALATLLPPQCNGSRQGKPVLDRAAALCSELLSHRQGVYLDFIAQHVMYLSRPVGRYIALKSTVAMDSPGTSMGNRFATTLENLSPSSRSLTMYSVALRSLGVQATLYYTLLLQKEAARLAQSLQNYYSSLSTIERQAVPAAFAPFRPPALPSFAVTAMLSDPARSTKGASALFVLLIDKLLSQAADAMSFAVSAAANRLHAYLGTPAGGGRGARGGGISMSAMVAQPLAFVQQSLSSTNAASLAGISYGPTRALLMQLVACCPTFAHLYFAKYCGTASPFLPADVCSPSKSVLYSVCAEAALMYPLLLMDRSAVGVNGAPSAPSATSAPTLAPIPHWPSEEPYRVIEQRRVSKQLVLQSLLTVATGGLIVSRSTAEYPEAVNGCIAAPALVGIARQFLAMVCSLRTDGCPESPTRLLALALRASHRCGEGSTTEGSEVTFWMSQLYVVTTHNTGLRIYRPDRSIFTFIWSSLCSLVCPPATSLLQQPVTSVPAPKGAPSQRLPQPPDQATKLLPMALVSSCFDVLVECSVYHPGICEPIFMRSLMALSDMYVLNNDRAGSCCPLSVSVKKIWANVELNKAPSELHTITVMPWGQSGSASATQRIKVVATPIERLQYSMLVGTHELLIADATSAGAPPSQSPSAALTWTECQYLISKFKSNWQARTKGPAKSNSTFTWAKAMARAADISTEAEGQLAGTSVKGSNVAASTFTESTSDQKFYESMSRYGDEGLPSLSPAEPIEEPQYTKDTATDDGTSELQYLLWREMTGCSFDLSQLPGRRASPNPAAGDNIATGLRLASKGSGVPNSDLPNNFLFGLIKLIFVAFNAIKEAAAARECRDSKIPRTFAALLSDVCKPQVTVARAPATGPRSAHHNLTASDFYDLSSVVPAVLALYERYPTNSDRTNTLRPIGLSSPVLYSRVSRLTAIVAKDALAQHSILKALVEAEAVGKWASCIPLFTSVSSPSVHGILAHHHSNSGSSRADAAGVHNPTASSTVYSPIVVRQYLTAKRRHHNKLREAKDSIVIAMAETSGRDGSRLMRPASSPPAGITKGAGKRATEIVPEELLGRPQHLSTTFVLNATGTVKVYNVTASLPKALSGMESANTTFAAPDPSPSQKVASTPANTSRIATTFAESDDDSVGAEVAKSSSPVRDSPAADPSGEGPTVSAHDIDSTLTSSDWMIVMLHTAKDLALQLSSILASISLKSCAAAECFGELQSQGITSDWSEGTLEDVEDIGRQAVDAFAATQHLPQRLALDFLLNAVLAEARPRQGKEQPGGGNRRHRSISEQATPRKQPNLSTVDEDPSAATPLSMSFPSAVLGVRDHSVNNSTAWPPPQRSSRAASIAHNHQPAPSSFGLLDGSSSKLFLSHSGPHHHPHHLPRTSSNLTMVVNSSATFGPLIDPTAAARGTSGFDMSSEQSVANGGRPTGEADGPNVDAATTAVYFALFRKVVRTLSTEEQALECIESTTKSLEARNKSNRRHKGPNEQFPSFVSQLLNHVCRCLTAPQMVAIFLLVSYRTLSTFGQVLDATVATANKAMALAATTPHQRRHKGAWSASATGNESIASAALQPPTTVAPTHSLSQLRRVSNEMTSLTNLAILSGKILLMALTDQLVPSGQALDSVEASSAGRILVAPLLQKLRACTLRWSLRSLTSHCKLRQNSHRATLFTSASPPTILAKSTTVSSPSVPSFPQTVSVVPHTRPSVSQLGGHANSSGATATAAEGPAVWGTLTSATIRLAGMCGELQQLANSPFCAFTAGAHENDSDGKVTLAVGHWSPWLCGLLAGPGASQCPEAAVETVSIPKVLSIPLGMVAMVPPELSTSLYHSPLLNLRCSADVWKGLFVILVHISSERVGLFHATKAELEATSIRQAAPTNLPAVAVLEGLFTQHIPSAYAHEGPTSAPTIEALLLSLRRHSTSHPPSATDYYEGLLLPLLFFASRAWASAKTCPLWLRVTSLRAQLWLIQLLRLRSLCLRWLRQAGNSSGAPDPQLLAVAEAVSSVHTLAQFAALASDDDNAPESNLTWKVFNTTTHSPSQDAFARELHRLRLQLKAEQIREFARLAAEEGLAEEPAIVSAGAEAYHLLQDATSASDQLLSDEGSLEEALKQLLAAWSPLFAIAMGASGMKVVAQQRQPSPAPVCTMTFSCGIVDMLASIGNSLTLLQEMLNTPADGIITSSPTRAALLDMEGLFASVAVAADEVAADAPDYDDPRSEMAEWASMVRPVLPLQPTSFANYYVRKAHITSSPAAEGEEQRPDTALVAWIIEEIDDE